MFISECCCHFCCHFYYKLTCQSSKRSGTHASVVLCSVSSCYILFNAELVSTIRKNETFLKKSKDLGGVGPAWLHLYILEVDFGFCFSSVFVTSNTSRPNCMNHVYVAYSYRKQNLTFGLYKIRGLLRLPTDMNENIQI